LFPPRATCGSQTPLSLFHLCCPHVPSLVRLSSLILILTLVWVLLFWPFLMTFLWPLCPNISIHLTKSSEKHRVWNEAKSKGLGISIHIMYTSTVTKITTLPDRPLPTPFLGYICIPCLWWPSPTPGFSCLRHRW
jgi:hypothetical protein